MQPRQATVRHYDAPTRTGSVLFDDGTEGTFAAAAFAASGLRTLRIGQRVRLEHDAAGTVTKVTLITL